MNDLHNFVSLEPTESCTAETTAQHLLQWCKTIGVPRVWVSDTAPHLKNRVIAQLSKASKVEHHFAVSYTSWSNGTYERMVKEGKAISPTFAVGDFVLFARVRRQGVTPKLMSTWTGPWCVVVADHAHVYSVHKFVAGKVHNAHVVARLRFHVDAQLNI
ncbi:unnamed protein product, partial [Hapterophycus canaliculatus]